jgi:SAM-dependent methyltransferase
MSKEKANRNPKLSGSSLWRTQFLEWLEVRRGKRDRLTPPRRLLDEAGIGGGNYDEIGMRIFNRFESLCGVSPDDAVLDIGCGYGRMAKPFTGFLDPDKGKYVGFDIFPTSIEWCQKAFSKSYPHFSFELLNIRNSHYNVDGTESDTTVKMPYADQSFDFVFLTSVFTHLMPAAVGHYLKEIHRLLKPGGKCFSTFYLLDDEARTLIEARKSQVHFKYTDPDEGWMALQKEDPERCIAFPEEVVCALFNESGLIIDEPIRKGSWCERKNPAGFQDVIICHKGN